MHKQMTVKPNFSHRLRSAALRFSAPVALTLLATGCGPGTVEIVDEPKPEPTPLHATELEGPFASFEDLCEKKAANDCGENTLVVNMVSEGIATRSGLEVSLTGGTLRDAEAQRNHFLIGRRGEYFLLPSSAAYDPKAGAAHYGTIMRLEEAPVPHENLVVLRVMQSKQEGSGAETMWDISEIEYFCDVSEGAAVQCVERIATRMTAKGESADVDADAIERMAIFDEAGNLEVTQLFEEASTHEKDLIPNGYYKLVFK